MISASEMEASPRAPQGPLDHQLDRSAQTGSLKNAEAVEEVKTWAE
jgi:hypothetical protein